MFLSVHIIFACLQVLECIFLVHYFCCGVSQQVSSIVDWRMGAKFFTLYKTHTHKSTSFCSDS